MTGQAFKPKLLVVAETLRGGLGAVVRDQAEWFDAHGWVVEVAAPLEAEGIPPKGSLNYQLAIPTSARDLRAMALAIRRLRTVIHATSPTVIHCHGLRSFAVAKLASSITPYVTLHGTGVVPSDPIGYGVIRRLALRVAPFLAQEAFNAGPEPRKGWTFVAHASPRLATMTELPFPAPETEPVFLWLGRLSEQKLPGLFVEAVSAASKITPIRGVLAGDGPLSAEVDRLIHELDAPVDLIGHSDDVEGLLARSWALVLFSRFEGLAFAAEEAMWVGRPVICSPLPGIGWLLGDTGLVADDLATATASLVKMSDPDVASAMGARAADRIRELLVPGAPWPAVAGVYARHAGLTI